MRSILPVLLLCTILDLAAGGADLFVAPGGNDNNPGTTPDKPFATLHKARDAARAGRAGNPDEGVTIHLRNGVHVLSEPLVLTPRDSGSATAPVHYQAYRNEEPILSGGRIIAGWQRQRDGTWTVKLPAVAAGKWYFQQLYDNIVEYNHIHHIGRGLLSDMGGIYTLGVSPGTTLRNNVIHDIEANHYGGWGIYHDEGSSYILVENNVVYRTKFAPFNIHFCKEVTVRNNIFALGRIDQLSRGKNEPHISVYFERNIVYWEQGNLLAKNWRDAPYTFHHQPNKANNKGGKRKLTTTFEFDYNLYFNPKLKLDSVEFAGKTFAQWKAAGKDRHSVYADPLFRAPDKGDFTLAADSPALSLGFRPIDTSTVGPRTTE